MRKLSPYNHFGILILVTAVGSTTLRAQDTTHLRRDSLLTALKELQARIDALEQKVSEGAENGVHTRSGIRMELTGRVMVQAFANSRRVNNVHDPQFVRPDTITTVAGRGAGASVRQSLLAFRVSSPDVAGAQFTGDLQTDFFGGQQPSSGGRTFPLIRMRIAKATLRWTRSELMIGQDVPLIAPLNPTSVLASGTPAFATAGNLWLWIPQVRLTLGGMRPGTLAIQGALLAPTSGDPAAAFDTDLDQSEKTGTPTFETRVRFRWEMSEKPGELGCGFNLLWLAVPGSSGSGSERFGNGAGACDLVAPLGIFELRGEVFKGDGLKGLGGGGIGQQYTTTGQAVSSKGGWAQLNLAPSTIWSLGVGAGMDDPEDTFMPAGSRLKNVVGMVNFITHPSGPLLLSAEYRRMGTTYATKTFINDHLNLGFGFEF